MRVRIEKLVYGGAGLARTERGVVFVPRTAPGDVVEVEVIEKKPDYSVARLISVVEASADRQAPNCPNYETAGCCHWQHIRYARQLEIKEAILRETLQRTARLHWDNPITIISGPDTHYRLRASFHVYQRKLGFVEERSHRVVPILECVSLCKELNAFIPEGNRTLQAPDMAEVRHVHAIAGPPVIAAFDTKLVGEGPARVAAGDWIFDLHPLAFFQSNRYLLGDFLRHVLQQAGKVQRVLDLFCGSGFFSIPLAAQSREVLGVETSRIAIKQARMNAKLNGATNVSFHEETVESTLRRSPELRPDLVVLNPPRAGAGREVAELLAELGAGSILYVSCNPTTFAREARTLIGRGYVLHDIAMVDQFPNTYHIEMVAMFRNA